MKNKIELLAPAGDSERLDAAIRFGADAVYLGGKSFGMRATPQNFNDEELKAAVTEARANGVRVYLTCNTVPGNDEIEAIGDFMRYAASAQVDALIVADIGLLMMAKRIVPEMEIHISTQAGVMNYLTATELYKLGASRVVLARELSIGDIAKLRDKTPPELEIEVFVHGAMCMSFSGRCVISNYLTGRDANRGECAQPCRWGYHLMEEKRPGQFFPVFEDEKGSYILNAKDLCTIDFIDKLAEAGVTSLKIEGRAKSAYYVAVVTNAYRMAVDLYLKDPSGYTLPVWVKEELGRVSHREYSTGFYFGRPEEGQCYQSGGYVRAWEVVAVVVGGGDGTITLSERNRFAVGDQIEILSPGCPPISLGITAIMDEEGNNIPFANHPEMRVKIPFSGQLPMAGSMVRRAT